MKKEFWSMSTEQLKEWIELINDNDVKTVKEQIEDILNQCE